MRIDAAREDQRNLFRGQPQLDEQLAALVQHTRERKPLVAQILDARRAQVPARVRGVLDHHGIGQPRLLHPALEHHAHAARIGQDRDQRDLGMLGRHLRQIERQPRAHDDRIGAALARLPHQRGMRFHGLHHVHGDQAVALATLARSADLAVQRDQVGGIDGRLVVRLLGGGGQVGMVVAQVDAGDGADAALACHGPGQPVCRNAHAHPALHDGYEAAPRECEPTVQHDKTPSRRCRIALRKWE
ncbi:hypothetical protein GO307_04618 [Ralstonia solanacearum]|nr:hypothetical protein [Ralstonia solanacearum]